MAELGAAAIGAGAAIGAAVYTASTGFAARHENAHSLQVTEMRRHISDFEAAYGRAEVTEEDWQHYLTIRSEARKTESEYEESIEAYKETPVYRFVTKWKKRRHVRKKKKEAQRANRSLRLHFYESTSDASDTSSITAASGSPPRSRRVHSDEDDKHILSWAQEIANLDSVDEPPLAEKNMTGGGAAHSEAAPEVAHLDSDHEPPLAENNMAGGGAAHPEVVRLSSSELRRISHDLSIQDAPSTLFPCTIPGDIADSPPPSPERKRSVSTIQASTRQVSTRSSDHTVLGGPSRSGREEVRRRRIESEQRRRDELGAGYRKLYQCVTLQKKSKLGLLDGAKQHILTLEEDVRALEARVKDREAEMLRLRTLNEEIVLSQSEPNAIAC